MDLIDAATRFVTALGAATALWAFATHLVDVLAASRCVEHEAPDTLTQGDDAELPPPGEVHTA